MNEQLVRDIIEAATNDDNGYNTKFLKVAKLINDYGREQHQKGATTASKYLKDQADKLIEYFNQPQP